MVGGPQLAGGTVSSGRPGHAAVPESSSALHERRGYIDAAGGLREAAEDAGRLAVVEAAWRAVPGQRSGITWQYVQMPAGIPGVKPDRMICRFVADALGCPVAPSRPGSPYGS
jgi:hypothetical protein